LDFTDPMEKKDKLITQQKLGVALQAIIEQNKNSPKKNLVTSLRKLAATSGVEYSIIQKISAGKKDPQFTTIVSIADGLDLSLVEFFSHLEKSELESLERGGNNSKKRQK
jgi:transcriptional regulator with XRE-family HTH domain